MPENLLNYPDILGYIAEGARFDAGAVEMALAVRPEVIRAGRPFEAVLLLQNVADVGVEITAKVLAPEQDAGDKPGRFIAQNDPLFATLRPAEVGYLTLPLASLPDTTPGSNYRVAVAVEIKPLGAPTRIRQTGQAPIYETSLPPGIRRKLMELKSLVFSAVRRGLFGAVLEAPFSIIPAQAGVLISPDWVSLWSPGIDTELITLLERHRQRLLDQVLPQLQADVLFNPLLERTEALIEATDYVLRPTEIYFITRLLLSVLDIGKVDSEPLDTDEKFYQVGKLLQEGWPRDGSPLILPNWFRGLLQSLELDTQAADNLTALLTGPLYDDLLRDAIAYGFRLLYQATRQELGSESDKHDYGEQLIEMLRQPGSRLTFVDVYVPLVLGGVLVQNRIQADDLREHMQRLSELVTGYLPLKTEENALIFLLAEQVIVRAMQSLP